MSKGIIYLMSTVVDGLIKIGKTNDFENRMRLLEKNGYYNICGLKRQFAIEVDDYDEKEQLIHNIFNKSQIGDSELFSIDIDLAKQFLSAFDGKIIYPKESKEKIFTAATEAYTEKEKIRASNRHHFKGTSFFSSLTQKHYYTKTNDKGTLSIYELNTNIEIQNNSTPSKRQIVLQALKDLNIKVNEKDMLYQMVHKLEKLK